jgi:hypothetical protein
MLRVSVVLALTIIFLVSAATVAAETLTGAGFNDSASRADLTFAGAPPEIDVPWADIPPLIDGQVDPAEWADAVTITGAPPGDAGLAYTAYFLADKQYLYGAVVTNDPDLEDQDYFWLYFDNDLNGAWPATCGDEGVYFLNYYSTGMVNVFLPQSTGGLCSPEGIPAKRRFRHRAL